MERSYDFHKLLGCANSVNHLAAIEYGENGLKFDRVHNKRRNIWARLHPLKEDESATNLANYSRLEFKASIVSCLKKGLNSAHSMLRGLNMAPSAVARGKKSTVEAADSKHWSYHLPVSLVRGEDGDGKVMRESLATKAPFTENLEVDPDCNLGEDSITTDDLDPLQVVEDECKHAFRDIISTSEALPITDLEACECSPRISLMVKYCSKMLYKSTLVSELNGNPFLSKD